VAGLVHDTCEQAASELETTANAESVKRLSPVPCKTNKIDYYRAAARVVPIHTASTRV
jgi:hypothetical protein